MARIVDMSAKQRLHLAAVRRFAFRNEITGGWIRYTEAAALVLALLAETTLTPKELRCQLKAFVQSLPGYFAPACASNARDDHNFFQTKWLSSVLWNFCDVNISVADIEACMGAPSVSSTVGHAAARIDPHAAAASLIATAR